MRLIKIKWKTIYVKVVLFLREAHPNPVFYCVIDDEKYLCSALLK